MSKIIDVNERWKIKVDEHNYQLIRFRPGQEGTIEFMGKEVEVKDKWQPLHAYFPSLENAFTSIMDRELREGEDCSIEEYLAQAGELQKEMKDIMDRVKALLVVE